MTENGTKIETILTTSTDNFADRVLLYGQLTEKKEKADPSAKANVPFFSMLFFGSLKAITNFINLFR
jgi:hypothetical protein